MKLHTTFGSLKAFNTPVYPQCNERVEKSNHALITLFKVFTKNPTEGLGFTPDPM